MTERKKGSKPRTMDEVFEDAYPSGPTPVDITEPPKMVLLPVDDEIQVQPTLERAAKDVRRNVATIKAITLTGMVRVAYMDHDEFGTEEFEFQGCTIAQLVPFSEALLRGLGLTVPTIQCPKCTGRNLRNCPTCNGLGKVLASQVTSEEAAGSPTLDKYRPRDGDHIVPTDDD